MVTKLFFLAASVLISVSSIFQQFQGPAQKVRIFDASVMITITVPEMEAESSTDEALPIPPDEYKSIVRPNSYIIAEGLGTIVNEAGKLFIITHDHWSVLDSQLGTVSFRDGQGEFLVEMELYQFKRLIQSRDGGTIILVAPKEIVAIRQSEEDFLSGHHSETQELTEGDVVNLVYRQRDGQAGVSIMEAIVESKGEKQGNLVLRLRGPEGMPIISGDSGGGVWFQGKMVANMWTAVMMEDVHTGERRTTDVSIAALISYEFVG